MTNQEQAALAVARTAELNRLYTETQVIAQTYDFNEPHEGACMALAAAYSIVIFEQIENAALAVRDCDTMRVAQAVAFGFRDAEDIEWMQ